MRPSAVPGLRRGLELPAEIHRERVREDVLLPGLDAVEDRERHVNEWSAAFDALYATWPISTGKPGDDTPNGTYLTIEKANPVEMKGPGYDLMVPFSVRFTWSGDYMHDAYWSVGEQGFENVSHGCVNLAPADAETYYNLAVPGDPITIGGSPRGGTWDNGWTMWFLPWSQYLKGSALHEAVEAGPGGSTFVDPAMLPPDTAKAPLQTAAAGNSV